MSLAVHCDREGCDTWIRTTSDLYNNFVGLIDLNTGTPLAHACCPDCMMHWLAANSEPVEEYTP